MNVIDDEPRLLRPINYPDGTPGAGPAFSRRGTAAGSRSSITWGGCSWIVDDARGSRDAPDGHRLGGGVDAILVDIHAEATSKMAMGHWLDDRVSLVAGTTAMCRPPTRKFLKGTAYMPTWACVETTTRSLA